MSYVSIGFCLAPINVSERLAISIKHLEAARYLLHGGGNRLIQNSAKVYLKAVICGDDRKLGVRFGI
jgi:hypothetical protein